MLTGEAPRMRRLLPVFLVLFSLASVSEAHAGLSAFSPPQSGADSSDGTSGGNNGGTWSDLPGGVAARPFVKSLKVINGGSSVTVFSGGVGAAAAVGNGNVTAVVTPTNLCRAGQTPAPNQCYATPNRVGVAFGVKTDQGLNMDFLDPSAGLLQTVTADTVFDVVIGLNTLGKTLRWTWVNGDLTNWKTTNLGADDAEIHLRVHPAVTPLYDFQALGPNGCTATPINNCDIAQAGGSGLSTNLFLSLDETLDPALTGTAFGTTSAIAGFLVPGDGPSGATLDLQMAAAHLASDGAPMKGSLRAFIPSTALIGLYGVQPADAGSFFGATRTGASGSSDTPTFETRSASDTDNDSLVVSINNITFSAPTYRLAPKKKGIALKHSMKGGKLTLSGKAAACKQGKCTITLYKAGKTVNVKPTKLASAKSSADGKVSISVAKSKLPSGTPFTVEIRAGKKLLSSTHGKL